MTCGQRALPIIGSAHEGNLARMFSETSFSTNPINAKYASRIILPWIRHNRHQRDARFKLRHARNPDTYIRVSHSTVVLCMGSTKFTRFETVTSSCVTSLTDRSVASARRATLGIQKHSEPALLKLHQITPGSRTFSPTRRGNNWEPALSA